VHTTHACEKGNYVLWNRCPGTKYSEYAEENQIELSLASFDKNRIFAVH
jgi:hypothetical protein